MSVKGKTILVTGSTDGVGRWVAERLAAEGARVLVHGRDRRARRSGRRGHREGRRGGDVPSGRSRLARRSPQARRGRAARDRRPRRPRQQRRDRHGRKRARSQRRRLRAALRGQLLSPASCSTRLLLPAHREARAVADRQRRLRRAAGDRLFRRDADPRLQRRAAPTARASSRRSCSPSTSPRS